MTATASTFYQVETVHSSSRGSSAIRHSNKSDETSSSSSPYFHHTPDSSTFRGSNMSNNQHQQHMPQVPPNSQQPTTHIIPYPPGPSTNSTSYKKQRAMSTSCRQPSAARRSPTPTPHDTPRTCQPQLIATISAGFTKGDYLIREERGANLYFDFFEEAYNFACQKGYARMDNRAEEKEYMDLIETAHRSVPGGTRYNTGRLLMVLRKKLVPIRIMPSDDDEESQELGTVLEGSSCSGSDGSTNKNSKKKMDKNLRQSTNTLMTDSESWSNQSSSAYSGSSASTSFVDSWE